MATAAPADPPAAPPVQKKDGADTGDAADRDPAFTLTDTEAQWCRDLAAAVRATEQPNLIAALDCLSHFELAQFAIVSKSNTKKFITRLRRMLALRAKYDLRPRPQMPTGHLPPALEAACVWADERIPRVFLACGDSESGGAAMSGHFSEFRPKNIDSDADWACAMRLFVALLDAFTCDLEYVRRGCGFLMDCAGMGMSNFSAQIEMRFAKVYQDCYPLKINAMIAVDAPWFWGTIMQICRLFLKKKLRDRIALIKSDKQPKAAKTGDATVAKARTLSAVAPRSTDEGKGAAAKDDVDLCKRWRPENTPALFGGTYTTSLRAYLLERLARRAEAVRRVRCEGLQLPGD